MSNRHICRALFFDNCRMSPLKMSIFLFVNHGYDHYFLIIITSLVHVCNNRKVMCLQRVNVFLTHIEKNLIIAAINLVVPPYNINLKNCRYVCMYVCVCGTLYKSAGFVKNKSQGMHSAQNFKGKTVVVLTIHHFQLKFFSKFM